MHPCILTNQGWVRPDIIHDVYVDIGHYRDGTVYHAVTLRCTPGVFPSDPVHATWGDHDKAAAMRDELSASLRGARRTDRGLG